MNYYCGIDVGKKGAICFIPEDLSKDIIIHIIPVIGNEIDLKGIVDLFTNIKIKHAVLEDVHSIFGAGAASNFQFGRCLGMLEMILHAKEIAFTKIAPKKWQSEMWEGTRPVLINTGKKTPKGEIKYKTDTKATSLISCKKLFPQVSLLATERSKVAHDGIVDAILMAEFCRRKFK